VARVDIFEGRVSEFMHPVLKSLILFRSVITQICTYVVGCYEEGPR
jgi:hypothetical protein